MRPLSIVAEVPVATSARPELRRKARRHELAQDSGVLAQAAGFGFVAALWLPE